MPSKINYILKALNKTPYIISSLKPSILTDALFRNCVIRKLELMKFVLKIKRPFLIAALGAQSIAVAV